MSDKEADPKLMELIKRATPNRLAYEICLLPTMGMTLEEWEKVAQQDPPGMFTEYAKSYVKTAKEIKEHLKDLK